MSKKVWTVLSVGGMAVVFLSAFIPGPTMVLALYVCWIILVLYGAAKGYTN